LDHPDGVDEACHLVRAKSSHLGHQYSKIGPLIIFNTQKHAETFRVAGRDRFVTRCGDGRVERVHPQHVVSLCAHVSCVICSCVIGNGRVLGIVACILAEAVYEVDGWD